MKLTKAKSTYWNGNGFGTSAAEWVVKGNENISVTKSSSLGWVARDTNNNNAMICRAEDKPYLLTKLENKLAALNT